jgi:hypothetical protein
MLLKKACFAAFCALLLLSAVSAQQQKLAHATIPFEFWIGGQRLPAGDYIVEHVQSTSYFVVRSTDGKYIGQAYSIPADYIPAKDNEYKLVFRVEEDKHYLYGGWGPFGKRVVTVESTRPLPSGESRADVPVTYR